MKFQTFAPSSTTPKKETTEEVADPNTIDRVMRLDPLHMSSQDLDTIIAYYRKARALFDSGVKPKKGLNAAGEKIDLSATIAALTGKPVEAPKPVVTGSSGIRRI